MIIHNDEYFDNMNKMIENFKNGIFPINQDIEWKDTDYEEIDIK